MAIVQLPHRSLIQIRGKDWCSFLQGLLTNDVHKLSLSTPILYSALLTPRGKFLADLFLLLWNNDVWIDCEDPDIILDLLQRYKLRSDISAKIDPHQFVYAVWNEPNPSSDGFYSQDPRAASLGMRFYTSAHYTYTQDYSHYNDHRIRLTIPNGKEDMPSQKAFILEYGLDHLNAISWSKGCYIGQEVTSYMYHHKLVRKKLIHVTFEGAPPPWGAILYDLENNPIGEMRSTQGDRGLCLIHNSSESLVFQYEDRIIKAYTTPY